MTRGESSVASSHLPQWIPWGSLLQKILRKGPSQGLWPVGKPWAFFSQDLSLSTNSLCIFPCHFCTMSHGMNRKGCYLLGVPRVLPHGAPLPTPMQGPPWQVPEHSQTTSYTPSSHLCSSGKPLSVLSFQLGHQLAWK